MSKMRKYKLNVTGNFICSEAHLIWQILLTQLVDIFGFFYFNMEFLVNIANKKKGKVAAHEEPFFKQTFY